MATSAIPNNIIIITHGMKFNVLSTLINQKLFKFYWIY